LEIARVIPNFYPYVTGPANQAYRISLELERAAIHSPIYTSNYEAEKSPALEIMDGVKVKRFPVRGKFLQYMFTPQIIPELIKIRPNIIHAHAYRSFQSDISYLISKMKHIPLVVSTHGSALGYEIMIKKKHLKLPYIFYDVFTMKSVIKHANYVIASSKQEFDELVRFGVEKDKIQIIPAGVDLIKYDVIKGKSNKGFFRILFVGRITKDRNLELLLEAFKIVTEKLEHVKLTIVGGEERRTFTDKLGYLAALKRKVVSMHISDKVEFTDQLYGKDLVRAYNSADVFVYTSLYENFGQTILEAAAAGLPIISMPVGVAKDIIDNGKTGFLMSFHNPEELSEKIMLLIQNRELRERFRNIKKFVAEKYRWKTIIKRYLEIYRSLL